MSIDLRQTLAPPARPKPIVIFGAGSIVRDAHLPAYAQAGFVVAGIHDPDMIKAAALGRALTLAEAFRSSAPFRHVTVNAQLRTVFGGTAMRDVREAMGLNYSS